VIYLRGIQNQHLQSILEFMYTGVTSIDKEEVNKFFEAAKDLKTKGISKEKAVVKQEDTDPDITEDASETNETADVDDVEYGAGETMNEVIMKGDTDIYEDPSKIIESADVDDVEEYKAEETINEVNIKEDSIMRRVSVIQKSNNHPSQLTSKDVSQNFRKPLDTKQLFGCEDVKLHLNTNRILGNTLKEYMKAKKLFAVFVENNSILLQSNGM